MWNSSPPESIFKWEEICYEYTKHIVERYGIDTVSKWRLQCFNEPDIALFFLSDLPHEAVDIRLSEYCKMYEAFERGIRRISDNIPIGGPALAHKRPFLSGFLKFVKERKLKLDFISLHSYGTSPVYLNDKTRPYCVDDLILKFHEYSEIVISEGFSNLPIIIDEWGMASAGFYNRDECPDLMMRETEVFSAYFAKLITKAVESDLRIDKMCICLSGQHEMDEDFTGFRNFFTLNFIKKPIYNAYILASKLGESLLTKENDRENIFVVPTKNEKEDYAILISYSDEYMTDNLPEIEETVEFEQDISDKTVTIWCIDKEHTNPYRMFEKMGVQEPDAEQIKLLREEGKMKPVKVQKGTEKITLKLTPNATFLITVQA
jgi:xylan 1,4-beta-xylosidase